MAVSRQSSPNSGADALENQQRAYKTLGAMSSQSVMKKVRFVIRKNWRIRLMTMERKNEVAIQTAVLVFIRYFLAR